ncbi:hypothetical protein [Beihai weivirus-like virus 7]|uniref:hypothetical protein n=1 Tax=Beihai weivirus-like virus 7 TaxID=1922754 RepID=UPI00090A4B70|nr:hypothetical protein [Beihai weivirus-like virus 7]APG78102.1 hypothetical protein [Beihai weivirus-like virus 7]
MARARKNGTQARKRMPRRGRRSGAPAVQAQGTGTTVAVPFGSNGRRRKSMAAMAMQGWNAFHPYHLPLPRAVGPYTVIRTSTLITNSHKFMQFGTFVDDNGFWTNVVGLGSVVSSDPINGGGNTALFTVPTPAVASLSGTGFTCVPASLSVQVMNNTALMQANGIFGGGVCHTQMSLGGRAETYNDLSTEFISYMRPRLMSGGKLALKGVQMDSYPMNMSALANFEKITKNIDHNITYSAGPYATGMAPIIFVNQSEAEITYLACIEWRVRFDIGSAAVASHVHHGVTPDSLWNDCVQTAVSLGHGVKEIADTVATVGTSINNVRAALFRANPQPMLVD